MESEQARQDPYRTASMTRYDACILIADDEPDLLGELADYLRRRGQKVLDVTSYGEAVRAYDDNAGSIVLVLSDVRMSDGNGVDLARLVIDRSNGQCPCLLMTGHLEQDGLGADLEAAGVRLLPKPFGMATLYASVLGAIAAHGDKGPSEIVQTQGPPICR